VDASVCVSPFLCREGSSPGMAKLFEGADPQLSINVEEIFLCDNGNFEEPNKVLELYAIVID